MKNKKIIFPLIAVFIVTLVFIFYKEGILFGTSGSSKYSDSLKFKSDSVKGTEVPLGNPPDENVPNISNDTSKSGSSYTGAKPDGNVPGKNSKNEKLDTNKKIVPLGDPPVDKKNNNPGNRSGNETPAEKDKSK